MTFAEFRRWAWERHGYHISADGGLPGAYRAVWGMKFGDTTANGTGVGNRAQYTETQRRRFAVWLRCHELVGAPADWLDAAETRDAGWLINCGTGIWWTENPEIVAHDLARSGFIAIRCGVEP